MKKIFTFACSAVAVFSTMATGFEPQDGVWYRLLNRETGGGRTDSYLGYYPSTQWYVFNKDNGSRSELGTNPFVCAGNLAEGDNVTEAQVDGQLWQFVAGEGDNAGKFCLVNKAYPDGAVSNAIVDNNSEIVTVLNGNNATNASRWVYLENREESVDKICWFDCSTTADVNGVTYIQPTFVNSLNTGGIYFALAAGGQKQQIIRVNTSGEASTWWAPIADVSEPVEPVDPETASTPVGGIWYQIKSGENDNRANTYLGYYPATEWYVFSHTTASATKVLTTNPFICGCSPVEDETATEAQVDGQLWRVIAGNGENEGKYCLVNKSFPNGAISNVPLNNNGDVLTSGATNASRWGYVADREANASEVCWFSLSDGAIADGYSAFILEFVNSVTPNNKYMALAKAGQNFQLMRYNTIDDASSHDTYRWSFIPYSLSEEASVSVSGFGEVVDDTFSFSAAHTSFEVTLTAPEGYDLYYKNNTVAEDVEAVVLADVEEGEDGFTLAEGGRVTLTVEKPGDIQCYVTAKGLKSELKTLNFIDPDGVTSAINEVSVETMSESIFDLQGRPVNRAVNGLYIINGKKFIVK